jgi:hypothetical protein
MRASMLPALAWHLLTNTQMLLSSSSGTQVVGLSELEPQVHLHCPLRPGEFALDQCLFFSYCMKVQKITQSFNIDVLFH